jgi:hypothetical protein
MTTASLLAASRRLISSAVATFITSARRSARPFRRLQRRGRWRSHDSIRGSARKSIGFSVIEMIADATSRL